MKDRNAILDHYFENLTKAKLRSDIKKAGMDKPSNNEKRPKTLKRAGLRRRFDNMG